MKKILFVANTYKHLRSFHIPYIEWLHKAGYRVDVIANNREQDIPFASHCFDWCLTRSPYSPQNIKAYYALKKLIEQEAYDLIHCHTATASAITRMAARRLRAKGECKVVYTAHGFHFFNGSPRHYWWFYYPIEKYLSAFTDGIVLINNEDYELVTNHGFSNTHTFFLNGIGVNSSKFSRVSEAQKASLRRKNGYTPQQFLLIFVGEYIPRKNHTFIIDALPALSRQIPEVKVLFAGRGALMEEMKHYAQTAGVDHYIDFLGVRWDLEEVYPMCDIGISSSKQEGLAIAIAEEMLCGLPVVASNVRGHRELVLPGETGYLFEPNNIHDFVNHVVDLYQHPERKERLGNNAYEHIQDFKIETSLKQMAQIYNQLLLSSV